jgi:hypothetical protein
MDDLTQKISEWFDSLTTRAKKAVLRRQSRRAEKATNRAAFLSAATSGYCCPKCFTWHPTPEARRDCRLSHHMKKGARRA